jgi:hypothetical protein
LVLVVQTGSTPDLSRCDANEVGVGAASPAARSARSWRRLEDDGCEHDGHGQCVRCGTNVSATVRVDIVCARTFSLVIAPRELVGSRLRLPPCGRGQAHERAPAGH